MNQPPTVVRCFDQIHQIWWGGMWKKSLFILAIFGGACLIGAWLKTPWIPVLGWIVVVAFIVIPQILRIHRGYTHQICPCCGKPVGSFENIQTRIVLVCTHCQTKTLTDCRISYAGGPPSRIS